MSNVALVVDDSRSMRMLVTRSLRSVGFEVLEAGNGRDALEVLAQRSDISVVVTDLNMPVMDGLELIRDIRRDGVHYGVPVVFLTTASETGKRAEASAAGAAGYVLKPFNAEKIQKAVAEALKEQRPRPSADPRSEATPNVAPAPLEAAAENAPTARATTPPTADKHVDIRRPTPARDAVEIWGTGNAAPRGLFESVEIWGDPQPSTCAEPPAACEPSAAAKADPPSREPLPLHATHAAAAAAGATLTSPLPSAQRLRPVRPAPLSAPPAVAHAVPMVAAPKSLPAPTSKALHLPLAGPAHVALPRTFTIATARETRDALLVALDAADHIILDTSRVDEVDVAGLQLLCAAHHESDGANKTLTMPGGPGERMLAVARAVGFCRTKACHPGCFWLETPDHDSGGRAEEVRP